MNQVAPVFDLPLDAGSPPSIQQVTETMRAVLAQRFGIANVDLAPDSLLSSLGLDSLGFMDYAFELENALNVTMADVPRNLETVGDFVRFVHGEVLRHASAAAAR